MIYKATVHISTLYIYQISSTQELPTPQDMKQKEKKKIDTCFHFIYKKLPTHKWRPCIMGSMNENIQ